MNMNTTEFAFALAARLESLVRRADTFGPKTRDEILEEIVDLSIDLRNYARRREEVAALAAEAEARVA